MMRLWQVPMPSTSGAYGGQHSASAVVGGIPMGKEHREKMHHPVVVVFRDF